ncbi:AarF/ABC1/UbiB kinase family protein [Nocardia uniformis]|uniref:AarF/ABC1/UbiB kinase family protein n=1 Tax=Nocardia uniformis TaxID=53432 RepID=A0A849C8Y9_9NOCA|nr:AarF/ABC1/UbiB kinase family protein [Nocardia uniformis]NNH72755.1 AarF/ABC1/UbiB kinase family protein [Nocardia uniformis]
MATNNNDMTTSRTKRTAMLGKIVADQTTRYVGTKVRSVGRSEEKKASIADQRQAEAVQALVTALGGMRGAAMKIGQTLASIDMGIWPENIRDEMQKTLNKLLDSAPTVSFDQMKRVIEQNLGGRISAIFAEFDTEPIAAASIGQVYRAVLKDGREVAVKVQYPGIDKAIRADLNNLSLVLRAARVLLPNADLESLAGQIRERVEDELDYALEAQNQRKVARLYRKHPFIRVPDVITEFCGPQVLVTEFIKARRYEEVRHADDATRTHVGEILFRFYIGNLITHGHFSVDPHPGNFLLGEDGKVVFLDFGLYRHLPKDSYRDQVALLRGIVGKDPEALHQAMVQGGMASADGPMDAKATHEFMQQLFWWLSEPGEVLFNSEVVRQVVVDTLSPSGPFFSMARQQSIPADTAMVVRMLGMVVATVGQMNVALDWNSVIREMLFGEPPATALGRIAAGETGVTTNELAS